jgi:hypothetical protein
MAMKQYIGEKGVIGKVSFEGEDGLNVGGKRFGLFACLFDVLRGVALYFVEGLDETGGRDATLGAAELGSR